MRKFFLAAALTALAAAGLQAAPTLGVEWRAAANPKTPGVEPPHELLMVSGVG
jgi:hypothetical protein